jgi:hypothetical protein
MNGIFLIISNLSPFALSPSKGERNVFEQRAIVVSQKSVTYLQRHSGQAGDSAKGRISLRLKLARAGIQDFEGPLDSRLHGNDDHGGPMFSYNFWDKTLGIR